MRLILASQSPRRKELLRQIGLTFDVIPSLLPEKFIPGLSPEQMVLHWAENKARDVANKVEKSVIIAADTIVVWNNTILGKPRDKAQAYQMLSDLSGTTHQVFTGLFVLRQKDNYWQSYCEKTDVTFRSLSQGEIEEYLATGEYKDKAGAYGIQGRAAVFVEKICGCYFNIVGLPLQRLNLLLNNLIEE